jgi:GrpB-like predicted nucleotidyltransferase (UPF0157 family)
MTHYFVFLPMIIIVPYQANWPEEFKTIAVRLRAGLGDLALRIDHIGSTSVPGLDAKDNIDVQITVAELDDRVIDALNAIGYIQPEGRRRQLDHRPPNTGGSEADWQKLYFHEPERARRSNTHVRQWGRANQRYALLFRDYLRAHPASAEAYARLKRALVAHLADFTMYPEVKDPAVDLIYLAAEDWARASGWQPGPSDA